MNPKIYLVGGAVRDHLLGRESKDRDYVVVGATPEWMIEQGYTQVGSSFPVFLHPTTGEEYALARQERKTGPGYHGFETKYDPSITLEDDLLRRDLTINSMAMSDNGEVIDPYHGMRDLQDKILRHTSEAFADDPLRVLRLARFAARYGFEVHPETISLSRRLVESGELNHLPRERIWMELSKGLSESNPAKMMKVIHDVGAMESSLSEYFTDGNLFIEWLDTIFTALDATGVDLTFETKFLMCFSGVYHHEEEVAVQDFKIPKNLHQMTVYAEMMDTYLMNDDKISVEDALLLITRVRYDAAAPSNEMRAIIQVMKIDDCFTRYKSEFKSNLERLELASYALKNVDMKTVVASCDKSNVKQHVAEAKLQAIKIAFGEEL